MVTCLFLNMLHLAVVIKAIMTYVQLYMCTGASDDAVSCSIMLELLHVMSRDTSAHQHCVIFIFNGAEENVLQVCFLE